MRKSRSARRSLVGALIALVRVKAEQHGLHETRAETLELECDLVRVRQQVRDGAVRALDERTEMAHSGKQTHTRAAH